MLKTPWKKTIFAIIVLALFTFIAANFKFIARVVQAVASWQEVDLNTDGQIDAADVDEIISLLGCPHLGSCPGVSSPPPSGTPLPTATPPSGGWSACGTVTFGTQLISPESVGLINGIKAWPGFVFTGNVQLAADNYPNWPGWTRGLGGGTLQQITNKPAAAESFGIADDYECLVYGPESGHQAGNEALNPEINVPTAENLAEQAGKCLVYAPAVNDYETNIPNTRGISADTLVPQISPHVDVWGIQLGSRQGSVDDGTISEQEFHDWLSQWVGWIKAGNPNTKINVQVGFGHHDPIARQCLEAYPPDYLLQWRERMAGLADSLMIMPSQLCEQDSNYASYFDAMESAVRTVCE